MSEFKTPPMFFPEKNEEIETYVESILAHTLKSDYETEKLVLFSFLKMMFGTGMPSDENCPSSLLFLLQQTGVGDETGATLVDKLFMVADEVDTDHTYQQLYWYLKDTEEFVPAVIRLISVFQFYDTYFPEPIYSSDGKNLVYYPKTKKDDVFSIPEGIEGINSHAFSNNPYLEIIKIPQSVTYIGKMAFTSCTNMTAFIVNKKNPIFYSEFGVLYRDREAPTLVKYPASIRNVAVTISKNTAQIATLAFEKCKYLKEVSIESSETVLGDAVFSGCAVLDTISILDGNGQAINQNAFDGGPAMDHEQNSDDPNVSEFKANNKTAFESRTPSEIKKMFDDYIVGHADAKKTLSVAVYSHIMRCNNPTTGIGKSNILLCGPTGCGKTEFARTIAKCLNVPFVTADATSITETGMKGSDPTDMLKDLLIAANNNVELAQNGIIYIDEIDKLASFGENAHRESYSKGVQQGLLKIVEGGVIPLRIDNPFNPQTINFDTSNVLFIAGGAFGAITSADVPGKKSSIGFAESANTAENKETAKEVKKLEAKDFIKYGMTQEFIGRFPVIVQLQQLTEDEIYRIMTEPKNSVVEQYKKLVKCIGSELNFDDELLRKIASDAIKTGTGARGLRTVIEKLVENIIYELPDKKGVKKVVVHKGMLENKESAQYILSNAKASKPRNPAPKKTKKTITPPAEQTKE